MLIDAATDRLSGSADALAVTTTTALASTWLVPKLPRFARLHRATDVRIFASNDMVDLEREHIDVALRFVPPDADPPNADCLEYRTFPVCLPVIARGRKRPLRTPANLAQHVRLDFETILYGRPWYDWEHWFEGMNVRPVVPARSALCVLSGQREWHTSAVSFWWSHAALSSAKAYVHSSPGFATKFDAMKRARPLLRAAKRMARLYAPSA